MPTNDVQIAYLSPPPLARYAASLLLHVIWAYLPALVLESATVQTLPKTMSPELAFEHTRHPAWIRIKNTMTDYWEGRWPHRDFTFSADSQSRGSARQANRHIRESLSDLAAVPAVPGFPT
jgi:hypothetical protein